MPDLGGPGVGGIDDIERDLTCSICTDILYQPLTLLDCLHSFCGSCLKEWFSWQAASAVQTGRTTRPYTCPSCRESVRSTKADWRLTTLLEGYLKAHSDRAKPDAEKAEIAKHYSIGDDVLPPIPRRVADADSDDERLLADVQAVSLASVDSNTAQRRAERTARRERRHAGSNDIAHRHPARLTESRLREHDAEGPQIGHQPSLRSLLSMSDADPQDLQAEILQSIYSEGMLEGIDLDNLTNEQEEELTERIAEAYRRRRRRRDRSSGRETRDERHRTRPSPARSSVPGGTEHNPNETISTAPSAVGTRSSPRIPVTRPHAFRQSSDSLNHRRRSPSSTSQQSSRSVNRGNEVIGVRSTAEDSLHLHPSDRPRSSSRRTNHERSTIDLGHEIHQTTQISRGTSTPRDRDDATPSQQPVTSVTSGPDPPSERTGKSSTKTASAVHLATSPSPSSQQVVQLVIAESAVAPEHVANAERFPSVPPINCNQCGRRSIELTLHYNCSTCLNGSFNLCLSCYRSGRGCQHWFGFGYRAFERWSRVAQDSDGRSSGERPHVLTARRYIRPQSHTPTPQASELQEGAFCEQCFAFSNASYWYCGICLDGAWGFCEACVKQRKHCTHPLLAVAHLNTQFEPHRDPSKLCFIPLPHMKPDTFVASPVPTFCDACHRPIPPHHTRFHCHECNNGDYDICNDCYHGMAAQGRIEAANGPNGWRRCAKGHRMSVIRYQDTAEGGHLRITVREPVGGFAFKEDEVSLGGHMPASGLPPDGGVGLRCLALYSYFPAEGVADELSFPKNAEIREVGKLHEDWYWGVYAGNVNLFPSNHVRIL